ncbi:uncharacterized protein L201_005725 [Kwoniella dendrophila CBS 6074]|uniref:Uncharacterized protein n=1 Tax=Kwoniella dendrophila CBS 6074 TaxID=1295534 RepID=A0AAX4K0X1_9TREE
MEFISSSQAQSITEHPKNVYPCLAHIHIIPPSDPKATRRLSTGSFGSDDGGNALTRVISGGNRRKSSFGTGVGLGGRRLSFGTNKEQQNVGGGVTGTPGMAREDDNNLQGKWYWRVQAGVTESHLILLPLTQPPNPVLTTPPAPLSHAMPSHSTTAASGTRTEGGTEQEDGGLIGKMKNLFRRSSAYSKDTSETINTDTVSSPNTNTATVDTTTSGSAGLGGGKEERVIDQTPKGEMLPTARGNEMGATNLNHNAELGYPGIINGSKLGGIVIPLGSIDKSKIVNGGGKKGEGSWVTVPILSHYSHFAQSALGENTSGVGSNKPEVFPKSGYIKFEFDKDWIGAKGESELLHHHLTHAINILPEGKDRHPHLAQFHIGGGNKHSPTLPQTREVGPNDESALAEDDEYGGPTSTSTSGFRSGTHTTGTHHGIGTGGHQTASTGLGDNDLAAGATGDRGVALGHPVHEGGVAGQGGSLSGSSVSGKVGGEY